MELTQPNPKALQIKAVKAENLVHGVACCDMFEPLPEDALMHLLSMSDLGSLRALRITQKRLHSLAQKTIRSTQWQARPRNTDALRLAMWGEGNFNVRAIVGHQNSVLGVSMSDDHFATASWDNTACVWDRSSTQIAQLAHGHEVLCVALQDGHVATGSVDKLVRVWTVSGALLHTVRGHSDWVWCLAWTPAHELLSGGHDGKLLAWSSSGPSYMARKHLSCVRSVATASSVIATGSSDTTVKVAATPSSLRPGQHHVDNFVRLNSQVWTLDPLLDVKTLRGHTRIVFAVAASETMVISGGDDAIRVWTIDGICIAVCADVGGGPVTALAFQDAVLVSSCISEAHTVQVWDLREQPPLRVATLPCSAHVTALALCGTVLLAGGHASYVARWQLPC